MQNAKRRGHRANLLNLQALRTPHSVLGPGQNGSTILCSHHHSRYGGSTCKMESPCQPCPPPEPRQPRLGYDRHAARCLLRLRPMARLGEKAGINQVRDAASEKIFALPPLDLAQLVIEMLAQPGLREGDMDFPREVVSVTPRVTSIGRPPPPLSSAVSELITTRPQIQALDYPCSVVSTDSALASFEYICISSTWVSLVGSKNLSIQQRCPGYIINGLEFGDGMPHTVSVY
ncbi:hypothetical protein B0I35DRAFT_21370 [Stachybotrys elegans]|uniref:Uncharacterized protein n=1 Tax=Stachybotrys elegans TaxID=80388 RepID=A0A8K0T7H9_9HYPO|nr:hypothetical protein B0I35DRAFT_21370 [Stachybotrys elegans]